MSVAIWFALFCAVLAVLYGAFFSRWILALPAGNERMQEIGRAIQTGASAYLNRQYTTIAMVGVVLFVAIGLALHWPTAIGFLIGAVLSGAAGYIGMNVSVRANLRTAEAARQGVNEALTVAFRGGAITGMLVAGLGLLGVAGYFAFLQSGAAPDLPMVDVVHPLVGLAFGSSLISIFARLGGGIFTKGADVGADLVGKGEAGIPEDDPRNPAVIADLVGDNVGDCAGRGADLFESTAAENIGAMILGVALFGKFGVLGVFFPLVARGFGLIASIVGVLSARLKNENEDPMSALNRGYLITTLLAMGGFYIAVRYLLGNNLWFFAAGVIGIVTSFLFVWITQYYTEYRYRPVMSIAEASRTGPATNIITGFAVALECTALPVLTISAAILGSYYCGKRGMPQLHGAGFYGTAVATMGMLSTAAYILAMDTFGPITDNAGGIIEMSGQPEDVRKRTDRLDSVGNTTKALTKGYAIGSAALAAFLLFSAYLDEVTVLVREKTGDLAYHFSHVDIGKVPVFIAALIGAMLVFLFSAFAIKAVGRAAYFVIEEVRRQFRENKGIMEGTAKPDYGRCVDIVTVGALKAMVVPGLLAVGLPVAVGFLFKFFATPTDSTIGAESVAAVLMVGTIAGILLATLMNNGGGAWDNAKKFIETGQLGGKRSEAHKAAVVGDTVGDPFKDTAGPSLHVLIKLLSTITLVMAPLFL